MQKLQNKIKSFQQEKPHLYEIKAEKIFLSDCKVSSTVTLIYTYLQKGMIFSDADHLQQAASGQSDGRHQQKMLKGMETLTAFQYRPTKASKKTESFFVERGSKIRDPLPWSWQIRSSLAGLNQEKQRRKEEK